MVRVRPVVWWAAAGAWVPLSAAEYLAPAWMVGEEEEEEEEEEEGEEEEEAEEEEEEEFLPVLEGVVFEYDAEAEGHYNEAGCGEGRSVSI